MVIETQILSSLSSNVVVGDPFGPLDKISGKTYEVFNAFMQNKPNLLDAQMNVTIFSKEDYENKSNWTLGENKPNQNQFKPNTNHALNEVE